jgi:hypothetical protein
VRLWTLIASLIAGCSFSQIVDTNLTPLPGSTGNTGITGPTSGTGTGNNTQPPTIADIIGNSTEQPGRIYDGLILSGAGLATLNDARLLSTSGAELMAPFILANLSETSATLYLSAAAKAAIVASADGAFKLRVINAYRAADADVVLQEGEQGDPGATGPSGDDGLSGADSPQFDAACPADSFISAFPSGITCTPFSGEVEPTDGAGVPYRYFFVGPQDFRRFGGGNGTGDNVWARSSVSLAPDGTVGASQFMIASVRLPSGAIVNQYGCWVLDNDAGSGVNVSAGLTKTVGKIVNNCTSPTPTTTNAGTSAAPQAILSSSISAACAQPVINAGSGGPQSAYEILVATSSSATAIYGCHVRYSLSSVLP